MVKDIYEKWLNHPNLDPSYKEVLEQMDEGQINDAFYTTIEFGTAGMRRSFGTWNKPHQSAYDPQGECRLCRIYLRKRGRCDEAGVAIGYDNRRMSKEFAMGFCQGSGDHNIASYVFESLRPTPELSFAVRHFHCFGGIMVTASHNPKEYNGYKLYDELGCQLVPAPGNSRLSTE